mgnify:CR=1 FL=1
MCLGNQGMNSQEKNQTNEGILVNSWTTTDPGNCFSIEEAIPMEKTYVITVLGTDDAGAGVSYNGQEYKNEATIETTEVLKKAAFQALAVAGKMAIITVNGMNVGKNSLAQRGFKGMMDLPMRRGAYIDEVNNTIKLLINMFFFYSIINIIIKT